MNLRRLNALDWILVGVALAALAVVLYRYRTQGFFDWLDLAYMAVVMVGYTKYRTTTRSASAPNDPKTPENKQG